MNDVCLETLILYIKIPLGLVQIQIFLLISKKNQQLN